MSSIATSVSLMVPANWEYGLRLSRLLSSMVSAEVPVRRSRRKTFEHSCRSVNDGELTHTSSLTLQKGSEGRRALQRWNATSGERTRFLSGSSR